MAFASSAFLVSMSGTTYVMLALSVAKPAQTRQTASPAQMAITGVS